ncbi:MAG: hypothetical protein OEZ32_13435 [Nitrospinota bacterium]|nr:hypothetical protein [Nitrospinota bacterium]
MVSGKRDYQAQKSLCRSAERGWAGGYGRNEYAGAVKIILSFGSYPDSKWPADPPVCICRPDGGLNSCSTPSNIAVIVAGGLFGL